MAIEGRNKTVESIKAEANYGFQFESVGDVRFFKGQWMVNGVPVDTILSAMVKGFNGTAAVQFFVVPVVTDYTVADDTLVQGDFTNAPVPAMK